MTVDDARQRAERLIEEDIASDDALLWTADFLREKVDTRYWPTATQEYEATVDTDYPLPEGFVFVLSVVDVNGYPVCYLWDEGKIRFSSAGTHMLTYRTLPAIRASVDETLPLPETFLGPLSYFIASRFRSQDDSEDPDAQRWMAECDLALRRVTLPKTNRPLRRRFRW